MDLTADDNLGSVLERVADTVTEVEPDRVAVVQGGRRRTWADLDARAARLAGHLDATGVGPGARVGIALYNSIEYLETLLAVFKLRAVPVNVNYRYREAELEEVLSYTEVAGLVFDDVMAGPVRQAAGGLASLGSLVRVGGSSRGVGGGRPEPGEVRACDFETAVAAPALARRRRSGADQIVILTGGTTGRPKGVVWEHSGVREVVSSVYGRRGLPVPADVDGIVRAAREAVETGTAPVMLPVSPLMHGTGFFMTLGNMLLGGRVVVTRSRSLDPAEVWTAVQEHRVDEMAIVGDAFGRPLLDELEEAVRRGRPYDIGSLGRVVSAGVRWSPEVRRGLLARGRMVLQDSIAATEGGPYGVSLSGPGAGSVPSGFALTPNARVIGPDGADVVPGSGQVGMLASTGALPLGYLDDPERTARVFRRIDGVRYSVPGDAARVEADGTLTLLGRGAGVVNTGGEKVFVEEVEETLLTHPAVEDVVVAGVPSDRWGAEVVALVCAAPGTSPRLQDLADHVGATLAGYKRPRQVFLVDTIRRTASGKTDRRWAGETAQRLATQEHAQG